jgi:autotransporter-associated beta strand protein
LWKKKHNHWSPLRLDQYNFRTPSNNYDVSANFYKYTNSGVYHVYGTTLTLTSAQGFSGVGSIDDHVDCQGTISAASGGYIHLNNGLMVYGAGSVSLGNGNLYVNDIISGISDTGQLSAGFEHIGSDSSITSLFKQTGGINMATYLFVGKNAQYSLSGGSLMIANGGLDNQGTMYLVNGTAAITANKSIINLSSIGSKIENTRYASISIDDNSLLIVPAGFNAPTAFEHYINTGILHEAGTTLTVASGKTIYGCGNIDDRVDCQGSIIASGGTINMNGGLMISGTGNVSFGSENYYVNNTSSSISSGSLSAANHYAGSSGTGSFTHSGGSNTITDSLYIGYDPGSSGTYSLSETGTLSSANEYIGYSGTGIFTQSGGNNTILNLSNRSNVSTQNGNGFLNGTCEYINSSIPGVATYQTAGINDPFIIKSSSSAYPTTDGYYFNRTEGINATNMFLGTLYLGYTSGSSGTYILSETGNLSSSSEYVGYSGTGTFTQSGGSHTIYPMNIRIPPSSGDKWGAIFLGYNSGSSGTNILNGPGTLSSQSIYLGYSGTGTFNQSVGTNTFSETLYLGYNSNSTGTYNLSESGTLKFDPGNYIIGANSEYIGYSGTGYFYQSGGINKLIADNGKSAILFLGYFYNSNGTYYLSGTGQINAGMERCGCFGTGEFYQSGGINNVATLYFGYDSHSNGTYYLTGGTLIVGQITKSSGTAAFNFGGGTLQAKNVFTTSMPITLTGDGGNANIDTVGYTITLSGILSGTGGLNKLGSGTLMLSGANSYIGNTFINSGKLSLSSTGSIASTPIIDILSGASFDVSAKNSGNGGFTLGGTQTIMGSGTVNGNLVAGSGSHIDPGDSAGILTISGKLTLNSGTLLDFELGSTLASDMISMSSSTLYLNSQDLSAFNFTALDGFGSGIYTLIDAGDISGDLGRNLTGAIGDYSATLSKSGNDLVLTVVPEPGTWMLLAAACLGLFVRKRKKMLIGKDEG